MSDLEAFLELNIENYVFSDLERMKTIEVGFPVLMTVFSAVELLGALLSLSRFDPYKGSKYFKSYWANYLYLGRPNSEAQGQCIYQLVRHGIAHSYLMKGTIGVAAGSPQDHLKIRPPGYLYIDCRGLGDDFRSSYETSVRPLIHTLTGTPSGVTMSDRLAEMEADYAKQAKDEKIETVFDPAPTPSAPPAGATAPVTQSNAPLPANQQAPSGAPPAAPALSGTQGPTGLQGTP
jgi:hypothetical protein